MIFLFFLPKGYLQLFVDYINKQNKCPKLSEAENDNSFSFLEIKITCHNQQFKTSVYRKPTCVLSTMKVIWIKCIRSH